MRRCRLWTAFAALLLRLCPRRRSSTNRPLSTLDDYLLDDLGVTREQAKELDERSGNE